MSDPRRSEIWRHPPTRRAIERELRRLGIRLRALREGKEWTLEQTAERASIHAVTLSRIENGQSNVTVATLVALSRALGVEMIELFTAEE